MYQILPGLRLSDGTHVDGVSQRVQGSNSAEVRPSADLALRVVGS